MIDRKYRGEDLIGKKCRPVRSIRNGGGDGITTDTVCTIKDDIRDYLMEKGVLSSDEY